MDKLEVRKALTPLAGCDTLTILALLAPGHVLVKGRDTLYLWRPEEDSFEELGSAPKGLREVAKSPDGGLFASADEGLGRLCLDRGAVMFASIAKGDVRYLQIVGDVLWYLSGEEIVAMPIDLSDQ